jgi:hypothetical protein
VRQELLELRGLLVLPVKLELLVLLVLPVLEVKWVLLEPLE